MNKTTLRGVWAIFRALARAHRRELGSLTSFQGNNLFLFVALLVYGSAESGVVPLGALPFLALMAVLLWFPLTSDPMRLIPRSRLALWPIGPGGRVALRLASVAMSPVLWIVVAILLAKGRFKTLAGFLLLVAVTHGLAAAFARMPRARPLRYIPPIPGRLGGLIRANLRQTFSVLDTYAAVALSAVGCGYRWFSNAPDTAAFPILAVLVALALSTWAQCLFGLDSAAARSRYRLLPLGGWQILLAKDAAFLAVLTVLVAPLAAATGLAAGLVSLAGGRYASLALPAEQQRWRFTSGPARVGVPQAILQTMAGLAARDRPAPYLAAALAAYLVSLWAGGRYWDRKAP